MKSFEDYISELQADMVSICLEYVDKQAENIYIYCSYEPEAYYFDVFYKIENHIVQRHELNKLSSSYVYDTSIDRQKALMRIGLEDLEQLHERCKEFNKDMPTEIKLKYDVKENSLKGSYQYDLRYSNDNELLPNDIFESWFNEVKKEA